MTAMNTEYPILRSDVTDSWYPYFRDVEDFLRWVQCVPPVKLTCGIDRTDSTVILIFLRNHELNRFKFVSVLQAAMALQQLRQRGFKPHIGRREAL